MSISHFSAADTAVAGLVKKIVTSASSAHTRRVKQQRRKVKTLVRVAQNSASRNGRYAVAMTLTFENDEDFSPKCLRQFTEKIRRWMKRRGHSLPYVWVLERQGRIHYHLILWLPRALKLDFKLLTAWWPWGATWTENCRSVQSWGAYIAKFCNPEGSFRRGTRLYGHGGFDTDAKLELGRAMLPLWLKKLLPKGEQVRKIRGGGWANLTTGEVLYTPYVWTPLGMLIAAADTAFA